MTPLPARGWLAAGAGTAVLAAVGAWVIWTAPERASVRAYTELLGAANRQDTAAARRLCTRRFAESHPLTPAPDGGLVGLPRNIHMRFQTWRHGPHVWLCPTNRLGPVYQFVSEGGAWRFDGPVGILAPPRGEFVPSDQLPDDASEASGRPDRIDRNPPADRISTWVGVARMVRRCAATGAPRGRTDPPDTDPS